MIYKELGSTSVKIPTIGQGCGMNAHLLTLAHRDLNEYIKVLQTGIELGMTYLDTAESYFDGHSEEAVGQAIKDFPRDKVFIATKFSQEHNGYHDVIKACEGSLKRLQTDYIDLYQIHWPNPKVPLGETIDASFRLILNGKVKYIGICNFAFRQLETPLCWWIDSFQAEYNLAERSIEDKILPYCQDNEITVVAYSPLDRGLIGDSEGKLSVLRGIAQKYDKTIAQVALNWLVSHSSVIAIPRTGSLEHLKENAMATDFQLSTEDIERINKTFVQTPIYVRPDKICVSPDTPDAKPVYRTLNEAIENRFGYTPSPLELAEDIKTEGMLKLPKVIKTDWDYDYTLIEGRIRYWGWVIAFGNKPIPVLLVNG